MRPILPIPRMVLGAFAALLLGCTEEATAPSELVVTAGNGQSGLVGTELSGPLVVTLLDTRGHGVAGLTLAFQVTSGGGSLSAASVVTDNEGIARNRWMLGTSIAPQRVEVRLVTSGSQAPLVAEFAATALADAPAQLVIQAGDGQFASPGTTVAIPPAVQVRDRHGNPVANHPVAFAVVLGGGTIQTAAVVTASSGVASSGSWTLGLVAGPNALTATAAGSGITGNPVTFTATGREIWTTRAEMPTPRHSHAIDVVNGILYAVAGRSVNEIKLSIVEAYDPATNSWTTRAPAPTARHGLGVGVVNGILYAVGGDPESPRSTVEAYDPAADAWTPRAPMPTPRGSLGVGVVNGILYAVGGWNGSDFTGVVEAYNPVTNSWTAKAAMTPRTGFCVGVVNGILYAVAGQRASSITSLVEAYDPVANTWSTKASIPTPRIGCAAAVVNGILYVMGGRASGGVTLASVEAYDPFTNTWSTQLPMPSARNSLKAGVVNGVLYAVGGFAAAAVGTNESWRP